MVLGNDKGGVGVRQVRKSTRIIAGGGQAHECKAFEIICFPVHRKEIDDEDTERDAHDVHG